MKDRSEGKTKKKK